MHNIFHIGYIESTAAEICADKETYRAIGKFIEDCLPFLLIKSTMEGGYREAFIMEEGCHTLYCATVVEKHYAALVAKPEKQAAERFKLVFFRTFHLIYINTLTYFGVIIKIIEAVGFSCIHEMWYFVRLGSGKKYPPLQMRQFGDETFHLVVKSHFKTFVKFVDDKQADAVGRNIPFVKMIIETSGSAEDHLWRNTTHLPMFIHGRTTAITRIRAKSGAHITQYTCRLQCQFPTRHNNHDLNIV